MPPSSAAWRHWCWTACCRAGAGPVHRKMPPPDDVLATRLGLRLRQRREAGINRTPDGRCSPGRLRRGAGRLQQRAVQPHLGLHPRRARRVHRDHQGAAGHAAKLHAATADAGRDTAAGAVRARAGRTGAGAADGLGCAGRRRQSGPAGIGPGCRPAGARQYPHRGRSGSSARKTQLGFRRQADVLAHTVPAGDRGGSPEGSAAPA